MTDTRIHGVGARGVVLMLQFNGKQGGVHQLTSNLRCPRNGKWTNLIDFAVIRMWSVISSPFGRQS